MEHTVNGTRTATRYCAACGTAGVPGGLFCASCGASMTTAVEPTEFVMAPPAERAARRRPSRRAVVAGVAIAVVVALVAALVLLRGGSDEPAFDHERAIADAGRAVVETGEDVADARTLAEVQAAGGDAGERAEALDAPLADVDLLGDADERQATREALGASQALLASYAALAELTPEALDRWTSVRGEIAEAGATLAEADRSLVAADLPGFGAAVLDSTSATVEDLSVVVEGAQVALRDWKAEADRISGDRGLQLVGLASYEQAFRGHDARYIELRKDLQDFVDRVDANGASYGEAYSTLSQATTQREEIRNALRALSPPPALAASHAGVVAVLDEAVTAMRSASEGVRQYEYSWAYWYYKDTPGWQTFMAASSGITGSHDTAFRAWEGAVAAERARIEAIVPPPPPAV